MALSGEDQARISHLTDKRDALVAAGFADEATLAILLAEMEFGTLPLPGERGARAGEPIAAPAVPDLSRLAGQWALSQPISIDCGFQTDPVLKVNASTVTIAFTGASQSSIRINFPSGGQDTATAEGTVTVLSGGEFEVLAILTESKVRHRLKGTWTDENTIEAQFRFEFDGSRAEIGPFGFTLPGCGDVQHPATLTRQ